MDDTDVLGDPSFADPSFGGFDSTFSTFFTLIAIAIVIGLAFTIWRAISRRTAPLQTEFATVLSKRVPAAAARCR